MIELAEEPYAKVSIVSPPDYVGNIMPMCQERRGEFKDMQYLDTNLVELHYSMPLGEIIYDFFDTLKARTKGYASLDYELDRLRALRAGEGGYAAQRRSGGRPVASSPTRTRPTPAPGGCAKSCRRTSPASSSRCPSRPPSAARSSPGRRSRAMRKDVLAKCYGGDITRKKKLLEKQKEGKKKMRSLGTVQIPTEAFMAVLKLDEE